MQFNPQTYFTVPRDEHHPKQPKLDETRLSMGGDGVLYKMLDSRDWNKYQILSDEEIQAETRRSQEVKQNILTMSGKITYGGTHRHAMQSGYKLVAPQFGATTSKQRKEHKQWTKDLANASGGLSTQNMDEKYRTTMTLLQQNTEMPEEESKADFEFTVDPHPGPVDKVTRVFKVIQQKYEQNLHVIDKLFDERLGLEQYAKALEHKLVEVTGRGLDELGLVTSSETEPPHYEDLENIDGNLDERSMRTHETALLPPKRGLTSAEAAQTFPARPAYSEEPTRGRSRSRPPLHSARSQSLNRTAPARSQSSSRRSLSLTRSNSFLSPYLQADIDNYVQKRRLLDEKEKRERLEAEAEEERRREKFLAASQQGHAFVAMMEREKGMQKQKELKLAQLRDEEAKKLREERMKLKAKKEAESQLMAAALKGAMSWQELQDLEGAQRRERIESRKQQQQSLSALFPGLAESLQKAKRPSREPSQEPVKTFKAEAPEVVARRLEKQQKVWAQRLEQHKEKLKEEFLVRRGDSALLEGSMTKSMELRADHAKSKREARLQAQYEREKQEKMKRDAEEREKRDRLLSMKLPESSLKVTKAAKMREEKVKNEMLDRELELQREKRRREQKEMRLKEAGVVLKSVIKDREEELKSKNPGMRLEVSLAEEEAAERAARAREEYRAKLRENKQRLKKAMLNRPSLLERHEQNIATRSAATQALKTITHAMMGKSDADDLDDLEDMLNKKSNSSSRKNSGNTNRTANSALDTILKEEEIFTAKEKIIVKSIMDK